MLAVAFVCYQATLPDREDFGIQSFVRTSSPGTVTVTRVEPRSPAANAGIRPGDRIFYGNTALERAETVYATPGSRVTVRVNGARNVTMTARRFTGYELAVLGIPLRSAFLLVAGLLAWRRPEDPAVRRLYVFLWCYGVAIMMNNSVLPTPLLSLIVMQIGTIVLFMIGTAAVAGFAAVFPSRHARPAPRFLANAAFAVAILGSLGTVATVAPRTADSVSVLNAIFLGVFAVLGVLVAGTLSVAYVQGTRAERPRRKWVFLVLAVGIAGPIVDVMVTLAFGAVQFWVDILTLLPLAALPLGLAYVILRHRVIDVGFVLNRAVVYGGVSIVIVGAFVTVETLLAKYVEQESHAGSVAVQLAVALVLGFSVRAIHVRVDRLVDSVMFRERHLAERAMHEFAYDAAYITNRETLLDRCVTVVLANVRARDAGVWLRDGAKYRQAAGTFTPVAADENDPAVVAMRARRVRADLARLRSHLPGTLAFPMIAHGELAGMLVCGTKIDDEAYAPDEREALGSIASAVAHALDALRIADLEATVRRLLAQEAGGATQGAMGTFLPKDTSEGVFRYP
jgi:hypothetical protein